MGNQCVRPNEQKEEIYAVETGNETKLRSAPKTRPNQYYEEPKDDYYQNNQPIDNYVHISNVKPERPEKAEKPEKHTFKSFPKYQPEIPKYESNQYNYYDIPLDNQYEEPKNNYQPNFKAQKNYGDIPMDNYKQAEPIRFEEPQNNIIYKEIPMDNYIEPEPIQLEEPQNNNQPYLEEPKNDENCFDDNNNGYFDVNKNNEPVEENDKEETEGEKLKKYFNEACGDCPDISDFKFDGWKDHKDKLLHINKEDYFTFKTEDDNYPKEELIEKNGDDNRKLYQTVFQGELDDCDVEDEEGNKITKRLGQGHGALYSSDGIKIGKWVNGKLNGWGREVKRREQKVYEGEYERGKLNGYGEYDDKKHGASYKGGHKYGVIEGEGRKVTQAYVYEGCFQNGKFEGKGKYTDKKTGAEFNGEFKENLIIHGTATNYFKKGTVYDGPFKNNKPHGKGKVTFYDNNGNLIKTKEWEFEDGHRVQIKDGKRVILTSTQPLKDSTQLQAQEENAQQENALQENAQQENALQENQ